MISVDPSGAIAPFEQVRSQIADSIRSGELPEGYRLPSIRQLAADLRVAAGTVAKAYTALEAEGLIESSRARGTRVRGGHAHGTRVREAAKAFVAAADGITLDEALGAVRAAWGAAPHGG
ncbi:GntR family transcriptional regulator [Microbacterium oxydans]|jgi:GntR family transcriptional regulator|uniref:GntR family transcriptional regulator n=1 Tax=Microbacterium oxydans TaxID=82380 RepID=UPI00226B763B|nr:GntR family transcriptional regulator [Microbacterium oxydans]WAA65058.1 GntR family transcriptional regulator [Microbacterium oxydans]